MQTRPEEPPREKSRQPPDTAGTRSYVEAMSPPVVIAHDATTLPPLASLSQNAKLSRNPRPSTSVLPMACEAPGMNSFRVFIK